MRASTFFAICLSVLLGLGAVVGARIAPEYVSSTFGAVEYRQYLYPVVILSGMLALVALLNRGSAKYVRNTGSDVYRGWEEIRRAVAYEEPLPDSPSLPTDGVIDLTTSRERR